MKLKHIDLAFLRDRARRLVQASERRHMDSRIQEAVELLTADLTQDFSLPELAERVDLSTSRFSELFRTETGVSPKRYFLGLKLEHARHLLVTTTLKVAAIMKQVGFRDNSDFGRQFKRAYGLSPLQYRKAVKKTAS